jgi:hypothetical protein
MRALEVYLNGKKLCIAGVGNKGVVTANVNCILRGGAKDEISLDTGGLNSAGEEHLRWHDRKLRVGDKVEVRIIEAAKCDEPMSRKPMKVSPGEQLRFEKRYVRQLAKKLGWTIQTRPMK